MSNVICKTCKFNDEDKAMICSECVGWNSYESNSACDKAKLIYGGKCGIPECAICYASEEKMLGIKYDKGKPRIGEMIMDFAKPLFQVCKVWEFGAEKYQKGNWKKVDDGWVRYTNAMTRHQLLEETEFSDAETGLPHAAHIAWNALARLFFLPQKEG